MTILSPRPAPRRTVKSHDRPRAFLPADDPHLTDPSLDDDEDFDPPGTPLWEPDDPEDLEEPEPEYGDFWLDSDDGDDGLAQFT